MTERKNLLYLTFQYNYCFGGTFVKACFAISFAGFNTTIVSVELSQLMRQVLTGPRFNTTIVSVEHNTANRHLKISKRFNTTIVSVEPL